MDGNERDTHTGADGQTVGTDETFTVGGATWKYPGDDMLPPEERINCRCTVVGGGLTNLSCMPKRSDLPDLVGCGFLRVSSASWSLMTSISPLLLSV
jgi:hypothetical protein